VSYIDWNDESVPLGKRKQTFFQWLLRKGKSVNEAKLICYRKFYHEINNAQEQEHNRQISECYKNGRCTCGAKLDADNHLVDLGYKIGFECWRCR
jgi:hypothetical protein